MSELLWQPTASLAHLQRRAALLAQIRAFFAQCGVMEVETPYLSHFGLTDPSIDSLQVVSVRQGEAAYLHTSPEFPMKRLLAAGLGDIYQIARVFRHGEQGRLHNPEFTLLEWYRHGFDHHRLMDEVEALVTSLLAEVLPLEPPQRLSYRQAFLDYVQIDPLESSAEQLAQRAAEGGIDFRPEGDEAEDRDLWLQLLLTHLIEPHLGEDRLCFLYDYPRSQAALARISKTDPRVAERFELYLNGIELANGFHELTDAGEQRARFAAEQRQREAHGLAPVPMDERLLAAMEDGLPDVAGVALGVDRLVMIACGASRLDEVLSFPFERA